MTPSSSPRKFAEVGSAEWDRRGLHAGGSAAGERQNTYTTGRAPRSARRRRPRCAAPDAAVLHGARHVWRTGTFYGTVSTCITVVLGDLLKERVDCIVNAANSRLSYAYPPAKAVALGASHGLRLCCERLCQAWRWTGEACSTSGWCSHPRREQRVVAPAWARPCR